MTGIRLAIRVSGVSFFSHFFNRTIEKDADYLRFLENLNSPSTSVAQVLLVLIVFLLII